MNHSKKCAAFRALVLAISVLSGCEKDFELQPIQVGSPADMVTSGTTEDSPYTKVLWYDDFDGFGSSSQTDSTCYTDASKATCSRRLDWFAESPTCSESVSHLGNLDKCTWTIWDGFSFWDESSHVAYKPSAVKVENGVLTLRSRVRPSSEGPFDCGVTSKSGDPNGNDYFGTNCNVVTGGIDSKARESGHDAGNPVRTSGIDIQDGRVEIVARWSNSRGTWPALWMWRNDAGTGKPFPDRGHATGPDYIGEIDIMESEPNGTSDRSIFQTYHTWQGQDHWSTGGRTTKLDFTQWHTYGVERTGNQFKYIVDGAYVATIKDGMTTASGVPKIRVDNIAEYLMINLGLTKDAATEGRATLNSATFEVDKVTFFVKP